MARYDADGRLDLHVVSPGANTLFHALGTARFEPIDLPVAQVGQVSAFATNSLGLLTETAAGHTARDVAGADIDIDKITLAAGKSGRTPVDGGLGAGPGTQSMGTIVPGWPQCARLITDDATGNCMAASSTPTLGMLYPLSDDFFVSTTGDVGIGTTSPQAELHLRSTQSTVIRLEADTNNINEQDQPRIEMTQDNGLFGGILGFRNSSNDLEVVATSTGPTGDLILGTGDTERVRITRQGSVGIGTASPANDLSVAGDADFSGSVGIGTTSPANDLSVAGDADFSGSVGIGTTSPNRKLHIVGDMQVDLPDGTSLCFQPQFPGPKLRIKRTDGTSYFESAANLIGVGGVLIYWTGLVDFNQFARVGMYWDQNAGANGGVLFADVKNFRTENPRDPETDIVYACVEGPEAAAYVRGTGQLVNGKATIALPQHFSDVAIAEGMTVQLTPQSADSLGLAVVSRSAQQFVVRELHKGNGSYAFDWEVKAVRRGFEDYEVIRPKLRIAETKQQGQLVSND